MAEGETQEPEAHQAVRKLIGEELDKRGVATLDDIKGVMHDILDERLQPDEEEGAGEAGAPENGGGQQKPSSLLGRLMGG
jgi:hypothetical protein